jgi:hypothetical protein
MADFSAKHGGFFRQTWRIFPPNMADFSAKHGGFFRQPWWIFPLIIADCSTSGGKIFCSTCRSGFFRRLLQIFQPALVNFFGKKNIAATN